MPDPNMAAYDEFYGQHLPNLFRFVVGIAHENQYDESCIGSGVLVNLNGRHVVATAGHCIKRNPRIFYGETIMEEDKDGNPCFPHASRVRILKKDIHPTLDVGYLEIERPPEMEMTQDQLSFATPTGGAIHIIGHPSSRIEIDVTRREVIISRCNIATTVVEITDSYMKLDYPVDAVRYENSAFTKGHQFPDAPGLSGGGCFGVTKTQSAGLDLVEYKLLAIPYQWHPAQRWLKAVPIKHWFDHATKSL